MSDNLIFRDHLCLVVGLISGATGTMISADKLLRLSQSREEIVADLVLNQLFGELTDSARIVLKSGAEATPTSIRPAANTLSRDTEKLLVEEERAGRVLLRILENQEHLRPTVNEYEMIRRDVSLALVEDDRHIPNIFDGIL